jgi:hypothetical protein
MRRRGGLVCANLHPSRAGRESAGSRRDANVTRSRRRQEFPPASPSLPPHGGYCSSCSRYFAPCPVRFDSHSCRFRQQRLRKSTSRFGAKISESSQRLRLGPGTRFCKNVYANVGSSEPDGPRSTHGATLGLVRRESLGRPLHGAWARKPLPPPNVGQATVQPRAVCCTARPCPFGGVCPCSMFSSIPTPLPAFDVPRGAAPLAPCGHTRRNV